LNRVFYVINSLKLDLNIIPKRRHSCIVAYRIWTFTKSNYL